MTTLRQFLSDLALVPRIWRELVRQAREERDRAASLVRYQAARASDPDGVAELRRLCTEPSVDLRATQAKRQAIMDRWQSQAGETAAANILAEEQHAHHRVWHAGRGVDRVDDLDHQRLDGCSLASIDLHQSARQADRNLLNPVEDEVGARQSRRLPPRDHATRARPAKSAASSSPSHLANPSISPKIVVSEAAP